MAETIDFTRLEIQRKKSLRTRDFFIRFQEELSLTLKTGDDSLATEIVEPNLHRPGLAFAGFTEVYSPQRVQVIGTTEWFYLESVGPEKRREIFSRLKSFPSPLWVMTHKAGPHEELVEMCREQNVPIVSTARETMDFCTKLQEYLEEWFAPYCAVHASLVDVYGVGMLYVGESGVGKSECVLDLVERGHRLVADDMVNLIRRGRFVIGKGNKLLGHHMEIRGVGIVDVAKLFGIRATRNTKKVEVIVELQRWREGENYDRTGLDPINTEAIGITIPKVIIPVSPGKNITVISEVVAMNMLLKMNGVDAAKLFNEKLIESIKGKSPVRAHDAVGEAGRNATEVHE